MKSHFTRGSTWLFGGVFLAASLALLSTGCGDEDGPGGGTTSPPKEDEAITALKAMMKQACERQAECGYPIVNQEDTVGKCIGTSAEAYGALPTDVKSGPVILSKDRLDQCIQSLASATCEDLAQKHMNIDPACTTFWVGTLAEGDACRGGFVDDCQDGLRCDLSANVCPGACEVIPEPCLEGACEAGSYCSLQDGCSTRGAIGDACELVPSEWLSESACQAGAFCKGGECAARVPDGDSCTGDYIGECVEGFTCRCTLPDCSTGRTCIPEPKLGEACVLPHDCAPGLFCNFVAGGKCDERKPEGEACPPAVGSCQPGLRCEAGKCASKPAEPAPLPLLEKDADCTAGGICPLGQACQCDDPDCMSGVRLCLPGLPEGASCAKAYVMNASSPWVCEKGICDDLGSFTCVTPSAPGADCAGERTRACAYQVCKDSKCAPAEETGCTL
ncbi:MAG: hypothetical protein R3B70_45780 [Polyangiaceae bacterium]